MLGSATEADDILQETFLRWSTRTETDVDSPRAFLTTILVRLCLDQLKSARARRETYVGPWLPEPILETTPEEQTSRAESVHIAFLVLLERLTPLERAAFLLHEVFDQSFADIAVTLGTTEAACRQLASRARAHVDEGRARFAASEEKKRELLASFLGACIAGDASALTKILADDVVARSDGGGRVHAAQKPIYGPDKVARFLIGVAKKGGPGYLPRLANVNGEPGIVLEDANGNVLTVLTLSVSGDRINDVWIVNNPEKLGQSINRR
jgi:RNA polymerase sigma-70 factor (ECF subfamily)